MGVPIVDEPRLDKKRRKHGMKKLPPSYPSYSLASSHHSLNPHDSLGALVQRMEGASMVGGSSLLILIQEIISLTF